MAPSSRRSLILAGVFCLIPLLNFPLALVSDRTLFARDISMVWAPQIEAVVRQIGHGQAPFFDSRRAFGQPLLADPRAEVLYPPAWIHWSLRAERSYTIFCAFHLVSAALGAARLARRLVPGGNGAAEATAGVAYAASGPLLSMVSNWHHLAAAAWMPWIIERADPRPGGRTPWLSLSILVALQILAGSPDYTFLTILLCLLRLITRTDSPSVQRARVLLAIALGVSLSAIQLLPTLAFARDAARDSLPIGWALSPLHPALTLETILPVRAVSWPLRPEARAILFGDSQVWMFSHYLGLSVWTLALLGLLGRDRTNRSFAMISAVLGLVFAWGVRNDLLQSLLAQVPLVSGLRFPTKHLAATSLGLALLAAKGVTESRPWTARARRSTVAFVALALMAGGGLFYWATSPSGQVAPAGLWPLLLACLCAFAVLAAGPRLKKGWPVLPLVVALDLLAAHQGINPTTPAWAFRDRPPLSATIPRGSRIYVSDYSIRLRDEPLRQPAGVPYRLRTVPKGFDPGESIALAATWYLNPPSAGRFGYYGSFDLDILDFYRAPLKRVIRQFVASRDPEFILDRLRRGSVEYVVTMDGGDLWNALPLIAEQTQFFEAKVRVYKVKEPWPMVRIERLDGTLSPESPRVLEMLDSRIRVEATLSSAAQLVVARSNERGWRASVDGEQTPVWDNDLAFLSVPLKAGHHVVDLVYRPPFLVQGAALSALSLIVVLVLSSAWGRSSTGRSSAWGRRGRWRFASSDPPGRLPVSQEEDA